jgi:hypothetical protein
MRCVASPIRTPVARVLAGLDDRRDGNRHDELRTPLADVGELRRNLVDEIPGEDENVVRTCLRDPLRRMYRDVRPGGEEPVLVWIAIHGVIDKIGTDPAVVEERIALSRRAVTDDLLPVASQSNEQLEQSALRLLDVPSEPGVPLGRPKPCPFLSLEELGDRGAHVVWASSRLRVDAQ